MFAPSLALAKADAHAIEHRNPAQIADGHSPEDGHIPHHRHDHDGEPIPLSMDAGIRAAARTQHAGGEHVLPPQLLTPLTATLCPHVSPDGPRFQNHRARPPSPPEPGGTLPLLI